MGVLSAGVSGLQHLTCWYLPPWIPEPAALTDPPEGRAARGQGCFPACSSRTLDLKSLFWSLD